MSNQANTQLDDGGALSQELALMPEHGDASMDGNEHVARPIPRISIQAFCEETASAEVLQIASEDRRLAKAHVSIHMGGAPAAVAHYQESPTPNLIILESTLSRQHMINEIDRLAEVCDAGTKVIAIGHMNDVLLYRELLRRGVSEYLIAPITPLQLMESISNLYNDPDADPVGHVITFVGAKGGAGSSTVCHNSSWAISESYQSSVIIADFDLPFGTAGLDFNQDPVQGLAEAISSPERLDEVLLDRLLTKCSEHVSLFAAPVMLDREYDLSADACDMVLDVVRQNVPYVAVDLPHVWTAWAKQALLASDEIVITAAPDLANLRNAKNLIDMLRQDRTNDHAPHLVMNQVGVPKRPEIAVSEFSAALGLEPVAVIEFECETFGMAANNGQMVEELAPKSKAAANFRELAQILTHRKDTKVEKVSPFAPILERFKLKR
jgi:pilus assembly protein CpaE